MKRALCSLVVRLLHFQPECNPGCVGNGIGWLRETMCNPTVSLERFFRCLLVRVGEGARPHLPIISDPTGKLGCRLSVLEEVRRTLLKGLFDAGKRYSPRRPAAFPPFRLGEIIATALGAGRRRRSHKLHEDRVCLLIGHIVLFFARCGCSIIVPAANPAHRAFAWEPLQGVLSAQSGHPVLLCQFARIVRLLRALLPALSPSAHIPIRVVLSFVL